MNQIQRTLTELSYTLRSALNGHRDFVRFFILARSRTGSNLLVSYLNSHPNIRCDSEVLSTLGRRRADQVVRSIYGRQPAQIRARGFKIFYYHPQDDASGQVWDVLRSLNGIHIIHLKRRNILRTLASRKMAEMTGVWALRGGQPQGRPTQITLSREEFLEGVQQTRHWEEWADNAFSGFPLLGIAYEELATAPAETMARVYDFLRVPPILPSTTIKKQNQSSLRETISNYADLRTNFTDPVYNDFWD